MRVRCPNHLRHWFAPYGSPGLVLPHCVRCSAINPKWPEHLPWTGRCAICGHVDAHVRGCPRLTGSRCGGCGQFYEYDPKYHRCPGEWEALLEAAGAAPLADPYAGMTWVEEQMAKQYEDRPREIGHSGGQA